MVKGKKWFSLTADYAFGHDLRSAAQKFIATPTAAASPPTSWCRPTRLGLLGAACSKIRNAKPDLVVSNLAGNQITNFLKQYAEFGLKATRSPASRFDTALAWAAGKPRTSRGTWPLIWHHLIDTPGTKKFVADFTKKYGKPPENQAWGDYVAMKILARSMNEAKSIESPKLVEHLEKGAKFDVLKTREGYFRASNHQLMQEMYAVSALPANQVKNKWDLFTSSPAVPGPGESLEVLAPTPEESGCKLPA